MESNKGFFRGSIELGAHLDPFVSENPNWIDLACPLQTEKQFDGHRGRLLTWHFINKNVEG